MNIMIFIIIISMFVAESNKYPKILIFLHMAPHGGGEAKKTTTQNKHGKKHKVELGDVSLNAWTRATSLLPGLQSFFFIEAPYTGPKHMCRRL